MSSSNFGEDMAEMSWSANREALEVGYRNGSRVFSYELSLEVTGEIAFYGEKKNPTLQFLYILTLVEKKINPNSLNFQIVCLCVKTGACFFKNVFFSSELQKHAST